MSGMDHHACPTCRVLKQKVGIYLSDLADVRKKLSRVRDDGQRIDKLRAQHADIKAHLERARTDLFAHQAECDVAPVKPKGGPRSKIHLPLDELRALRAEGRTLNELAEHYGCSPGVIRRSLDEKLRATAGLHASVVQGADLTWQERALCAQTDPEAFHPEKGGSTRAAKAVCAVCEVTADCLEYALDNDERFGIWGGLSERERRKLKRSAS